MKMQAKWFLFVFVVEISMFFFLSKYVNRENFTQLQHQLKFESECNFALPKLLERMAFQVCLNWQSDRRRRRCHHHHHRHWHRQQFSMHNYNAIRAKSLPIFLPNMHLKWTKTVSERTKKKHLIFPPLNLMERKRETSN